MLLSHEVKVILIKTNSKTITDISTMAIRYDSFKTPYYPDVALDCVVKEKAIFYDRIDSTERSRQRDVRFNGSLHRETSLTMEALFLLVNVPSPNVVKI